MKMYLLSLGAGLLAGLLYGALNVRSPAPPVIALVGLLGILLGEQAVPLLKHTLHGADARVTGHASLGERVGQHLFGHLPGHSTGPQTTGRSAQRIAAADESKDTGFHHDH